MCLLHSQSIPLILVSIVSNCLCQSAHLANKGLQNIDSPISDLSDSKVLTKDQIVDLRTFQKHKRRHIMRNNNKRKRTKKKKEKNKELNL